MIEISTTKIALANSIKKLMENKPVDSISIKEITDSCRLNRKSFYYHFKDKYDLVNWIFYTEFVMTVIDGKVRNQELLERVCFYLYENKTFYINAFEIKGQNSFSDYFIEIIEPVIAVYVEDLFKEMENKEFFTVYFANAARSSITKWLLDEKDLPPEKFIRLMKNGINEIAYYIVKNNKK
ncbi:MAG: TetR family transcriptional regulator [Clostridium sp.]|nr:TetR family transcriptional regulator [Clostridium sp.]